MENQIKPGYKTSEFWVVVAPVLASFVEMSRGDGETGKLLTICATVLASVYIISRAWIKH